MKLKIVFHGFIKAQKFPSKAQIKARPTQAITQIMTIEMLLSEFWFPQNPVAKIIKKNIIKMKRIRPMQAG
jgi:hypothetical protein